METQAEEEIISKIEKTDVLATTRIPELKSLTTITKILNYLNEYIFKPNNLTICIDDSVITLLENESWDQKITVPRKVLIIRGETTYKKLTRRRYVKYHLCEALIRLGELVKYGYAIKPDNKRILIPLKHQKGLYPCMLILTHYASGKVELGVFQMWNQHYFFEGSIFLT